MRACDDPVVGLGGVCRPVGVVGGVVARRAGVRSDRCAGGEISDWVGCAQVVVGVLGSCRPA